MFSSFAFSFLSSEASEDSQISHSNNGSDMSQTFLNIRAKHSFCENSKQVVNEKELKNFLEDSKSLFLKENEQISKNQTAIKQLTTTNSNDRRLTLKFKSIADKENMNPSDVKEHAMTSSSSSFSISRGLRNFETNQKNKRNEQKIKEKNELQPQFAKRPNPNDIDLDKFRKMKRFASREDVEDKTKLSPVKLFILKGQKKFILNFQCYRESDLKIDENYGKILVQTDHDDDIETDDETLDYYVKKVRKQLDQAVSMERERKIKEKRQMFYEDE